MTLSDSVQNMYELFNRFDGFEDFEFNNQVNFSSIKSKSSAWPNYSFDLKLQNNDLDSSIEDIVLKIRNFEISPFLLFLKDQDDIDLEEVFYNQGIKKIETWPVMTIDVKHSDIIVGKLPNDTDEFCFVNTEEDLNIWYNLVSKVLFNKRKLNIEHFRKMQNDEQFAFLLIKNQSVGVAAALVYLGKTYSGLYMVATEDTFRGRGYGQYITKMSIMVAKQRGQKFLTLQSSRMAFPMYQKLGFKTLGEIDVFWMIGNQFK